MNKEFERIKERVLSAKKPLFFFDDDPDGLSSFAQFYKVKRIGKGVIIKSSPELKALYLRKVFEFNPDVLFVLDKPMINNDFIEKINLPLVWIDHHEPQTNHLKKFRDKEILYYNPRESLKRNLPVSDVSYRIFKKNIWLAMVGAVGDWTIPDFAPHFSEKYPDLFSSDIKEPAEALFNTELGRLIKIVSFMLKGDTKQVKSSIKAFLDVGSPYEILYQTSSRGQCILKRVKKVEDAYIKHLKEARERAEGYFLFYFYKTMKFSFTKELSNELLYLFPEKLIVVGRESRGVYKMSIRASKVLLPPIISAALEGLEGYGGGHEHACGAQIKRAHLDIFLNRLKEGYLKAIKHSL